MTRRVVSCVIVGMCALGVVPAAYADLSHVLVAPGNGSLINGSTSIIAGPADHHFNLTIDYAVFSYSAFSANVGGFTPFGSFGAPDTDGYLFAYQIYSNGPGSGVADPSTTGMSWLGAEMTNGTIASIGYFDPGNGEVNAVAAYGYPDSFLFGFLGSEPRLKPDQQSTILLISSPNKWHFEQICTLNGLLAASSTLPVPHANPAPSASMLVLIGVAALALVRPFTRRSFALVRA